MTDIAEQLRNYGLSHLKGTPSVIAEAADMLLALKARAEAAEKDRLDWVRLGKNAVLDMQKAEARAEAAEKERDMLREALLWLSDAGRYDVSVTSYARAALEAKP